VDSLQFVKVEDRVDVGTARGDGEGLDLASMVGAWVNTNRATRGIDKVLLPAADGALRVRAFGMDRPSPCDWGEVPCNIVYADSLTSGRGIAFTARYDFGFMESHLQANVSLGLLIIACFNTFKDGSGRANYYAREFSHRVTGVPGVSVPSAESGSKFHQFTRVADQADQLEINKARGIEEPLDPSPFLGTWINTTSSTNGIGKVVLANRAGSLTVQVFGVGDGSSCDWGQVRADVFGESVQAHEAATFMAFYDFRFMEMHLHAWVKLGVLVIAKFDRFKDGSGRSNRFSREFFYRLEPEESPGT
jgi:hypothetical protein